MLLRIGLHVCDVVHTGKNVHGDGVNLAARLEPLASPGCICISEDVARQIQSKIDYPVIKVGKKNLRTSSCQWKFIRLFFHGNQDEEKTDFSGD